MLETGGENDRMMEMNTNGKRVEKEALCKQWKVSVVVVVGVVSLKN